jgi:serine/threonine protein kinase/Tol biopolymer transport system component
MNAQHWLDVERLFHAALALPPHERTAFLDDSCAGNDHLKRDVQSLIDESAADDFLEQAVYDPGVTRLSLSSHSLVGRRLSEYEITARIGAGGMGEVYRAHDVKLGRDVAIKVLPPAMAHDPARIARFKREAQILATLNHPHIAAIYALEESDDNVALVLELVEGETLADRLHRGALPLLDALTVARQTADALEAAHARGIIHRDLKPANIKAPSGGTTKVLDFGLAKAIGERMDVSPPDNVQATQEGMILGTAAYMSPEQARGLPVDKRTDIWAFGCALYEMLTGARAFRGDTATDCLAAIVGKNPDWTALPPSVPEPVVALIKHCLEKDTQNRLADISVARRELEDALATSTTRVIRASVTPSARRRLRIPAAAAAAAGILVAGSVGVRAIRQWTLKPERADIGLANGEFIPSTHSSELALSNDGTLIAYASSKHMADMPNMGAGPGAVDDPARADAGGAMPSMAMTEQIYVRTLGQGTSRAIGGALGSAPFFSPDGKWLGFWHAPTGTLRKVALTGGAPVKICDAISGVAGAAWAGDDTIVFAWFDLFRVPASGGSPTLLLRVDEQRGERFFRHPSVLPSGKAIVFTIGMADTYSYDDAEIGVLSLETGKKKILVQGGTSPRYSPSGHLVYARAGKLLAVPFDADKLEVTGQPFPVGDGLFMSANTGMAAFSISSRGDLVYAAGPEERGTRVPVWVDRNGHKSVLPLPPRSYLHPRLSPDGRQLAIEVEGASHDIFTYDFARDALTKMSFDGASHWPSWTPDGRRLTFRSWKTGTMTMWWMPADRSGAPELLTNVGSMQSPESWSPDGQTLAFTQMDDPQSGSDIYTLPLGADRKPYALIRTKFSEGSPKFSPDGTWLAYSSNESGQPEVFARAYPGGKTILISTGGGTDPLWRHDGRQLYYRVGDQMMVVDFSGGPSPLVSKPRVLWKGNYLAGAGSSCGMAGPTSANYDITPDGDRFLMIEDASPAAECERLRVVSNWSLELRNPAAIPLQSLKR